MSENPTVVIKDVTSATFESEVLTRSSTRPVVVDFWAPWCAPCRVLGPILESEIAAAGGRVELAKIDTDANPDLSARYHVQGIPAVKAFKNGQVVDEFVGARPAPFIRSWLEALAPSPGLKALADAQAAWEAGRRAEAEASLRSVLDLPATRDRAHLLLARLLLELGRSKEARPLLENVDARSEAADALPALERLLDLAKGGLAVDEAAARAALAKNPRDVAAQYDLAATLVAQGKLEEALEAFLDVVSRDRKFKDDGARLAMLAIFEHLGDDHPSSREFRRRLQIVL